MNTLENLFTLVTGHWPMVLGLLLSVAVIAYLKCEAWLERTHTFEPTEWTPLYEVPDHTIYMRDCSKGERVFWMKVPRHNLQKRLEIGSLFSFGESIKFVPNSEEETDPNELVLPLQKVR